jgi:hypothetical protein
MLLDHQTGVEGAAEQAIAPLSFMRYLCFATVAFFVVLGGVLAFNITVDPLWYGNGNQVTGYNYGFDERLSKTLRFLKAPAKYDCVFFGSSRGTVLDVSRIQNAHCFNYAIPGAILSEMSAFARYVRAKAPPPKEVVIGIDNFEFGTVDMPNETPSYVSGLAEPPSRLSRYLSAMSVKALLGDGEANRLYSSSFVNEPPSPDGSYDPKKDLLLPPTALPYGEVMLHGYGPFVPAKAAALDVFRKIFPASTIVGYATPVSSYQIVRELRNGHLDAYLDAIYDASLRFDRFIDFSIPSYVTENPLNTRDGSHFSAEVNAEIAEALGGATPRFGILVTGLGREAYKAAFLAAAAAFDRKLVSK